MVFSFNTLKQQVEETIRTEVLEKNPQPEQLYEPMRYSLGSGGKRLRPVLMLMAYNMLKDDVETVLKPAMAMEFFHNFTLLHDDIMDNSPMRRNQPTVHEKWNASTAILSGDAMMIKAYELLTENAPCKLSEVLRVFNQIALNVCEGQQYDMNYETQQHVTEEEYLYMIGLKTSVLLAGSMKIGALFADAAHETADTLYNFGRNLGLAFQLQDDYLDTFGNTDTFGKQIGGDIAANKKTYLLIKAFELANERQRQKLKHWIFNEHSDRERKIAEVTAIYHEIGIQDIAKQKIDAYYNTAQQHLQNLDVPPERRIAARETAERLVMRAH